MEQRKEAAAREIESLKKARDLQKKMGRALMRSVVESRDQAEKERAEQLEKDIALENRVPKKKSVSFADDITNPKHVKSDEEEETSWGDVSAGTLRLQRERQPMKVHVVERHPRSLLQAGLISERDSDDESDPGAASPGGSDNDIASDAPVTDSAQDDAVLDREEHDEEDIPLDASISEWGDDDLDFAQHQREIVLEYLEKRRGMGAEASSAMRAHTHEEDEWDQPVSPHLQSTQLRSVLNIVQEVPLEASLSSAPPKQSVSRFKASRAGRNVADSNSLGSHSLGTSIVPASSSSAMQRAVRMGRLENDRLVGGEEGESDDEVTENTRALLEALTKGEVTNIGPSVQTSVSPPAVQSEPGQTVISNAPVEYPRPAKVSRFKLSVAHPGEHALISPPDSMAPTPTSLVHRSSPKLNTSYESAPPQSASSASSSEQPRFTLPPELQPVLADGQHKMPAMIVESPSFTAPRLSTTSPARQISPTSSLSPSSTAVTTPTSAEPPCFSGSAQSAIPLRQSVVERRPQPVNLRVQGQPAAGGAEPKMSRFKAQRS